jgi:hypothetical protein
MSAHVGRHSDRKGRSQMSASSRAQVSHRSRESNRLCALLVGLVTVLTVAACGKQAGDSSQPASPTGAASSASAPSEPTSSAMASRPPAAKEKITAAGIAAVITEHLGAGRVAAFGSYDGEPGAVDVMIRLRGSGRADNFMVTVYSPKQGGGEFGELTECPRGKQARRDKFTKQFTCHRLANGTTVTAYLVPYGFSDDNSRGHVVTGMAGTPNGNVAMALYESYGRSAPITVADVDELLSDPRLTWMTDPAVNAAGEALHIDRLRG